MSGIHKTALFLSGLPEAASATLLRKLEPETASKVRIEMMRLKGTSKETLRKTVAEFLNAINTTEKQPYPVAVQPAAKPKQPKRDNATYNQVAYNRAASTFDQEISDSGTFKPVPQTMDSFAQGIDILTLETNRSKTQEEPVPEKPQLPSPSAIPATSEAEDELFGFLHRLMPDQIRELLLFETPRIVAVLLTQLSPELAGQILEQITPEAQQEVVSILFELEEIDEEILQEIAEVLKERAESVFGKPKKNIGCAAAKRILQAIDPALRHRRPDVKPVKQPEQKSSRHFVFEDLQNLPDRGLREIFDSVDAKTALLSLVGAPQALIERIFGTPTQRQEELMIRQYQSFAPISPVDVEAARQRVLKRFYS